jgi:hypothetical protein
VAFQGNVRTPVHDRVEVEVEVGAGDQPGRERGQQRLLARVREPVGVVGRPRPFRVGQDMRKGRRLLPDILTLASHTTASKDEPTRPPAERPLPAHHDAVVLALGGGQHHGSLQAP